ncbi:hypothetical protein [Sporosarcina sp. Marseille-Q4943]|uniref:hypothetical protein n=1 Tax=Sporosarcina sp. Marseille-Q4943 TaxID=2942204 RepID=UPI00208DDC3B|nr:hypothetical protein [Sporosarcina sp. Marseille-Q4943]
MRTLQDQLIKKGLSRPRKGEQDPKNTRKRVRQSEQLTSRDWAELMGVHRPTYGQNKGGAFRQR